MTLLALQRKQILTALIEFRKNYDGSQADFCKRMGINPAAYSQLKTAIKNEKPLDRIISDAMLVSIGRKLNVQFRESVEWKIVRTETFDFVTTQLEHCQSKSIGRMLCDIPDCGKTTAAKHYMLTHPNVFYVDCGQCKEKGEFIRAIGKVVGVNIQNSVKDVYRDTVYMLLAMDRPLIILDEWGDLGYTAFLQIKAYWNALEEACGWYLMSAVAGQYKIAKGIRNNIVGFAEIYRRVGGECQSVTSELRNKHGEMDAAKLTLFKKHQILRVAEQNLPKGVDLTKVIEGTLSLTRVKENIRKISGGKELFDQQDEAA